MIKRPQAYRPETAILELGDAFLRSRRGRRFPADDPALPQRSRGGDGRARRPDRRRMDRAISAASSRCRATSPQPLALRYHGHQFRVYNPDLGDGRGFLFAQLRDDATAGCSTSAPRARARRPGRRFGDGRLTLKGGVREVLATEMLEALGVDTSQDLLADRDRRGARARRRALARPAPRCWCGSATATSASAPSSASPSSSAPDEMRRADRLRARDLLSGERRRRRPGRRLLRPCRRAHGARSPRRWMAAGFVHGVLNTDNINITGESFDYGPWRFLPDLRPGLHRRLFRPDRASTPSAASPRRSTGTSMQLAVALSADRRRARR